MSLPEVANLGEPVARGGTAELFPWAEGWLLKLFFSWVPGEVARSEATASKAVYAAGLPVPAAGDLLMIEGRPGFPIARLSGRTMAEEMLRGTGPVTAWARMIAELQAGVHAAAPPAIRTNEFWKAVIGGNTRLAEPLRQEVLGRLDALPTGDGLCHGDFHAGNVLITDSGPMIIDWGAAYRGNVLSDVAQTWVAMTEWLSIPVLRPVQPRIREVINVFTEHYFDLRPGGQEEFEAWKPVVAALRLSVPHPPTSEPALLELIVGEPGNHGRAGAP